MNKLEGRGERVDEMCTRVFAEDSQPRLHQPKALRPLALPSEKSRLLQPETGVRHPKPSKPKGKFHYLRVCECAVKLS